LWRWWRSAIHKEDQDWMDEESGLDDADPGGQEAEGQQGLILLIL
jgi:hypothetical protein